MSKTYIIFGGSRGLGDAFAQGLAQVGDTVYILSRSKPRSTGLLNDGVNRVWLAVDLSSHHDVTKVSLALAETVVDVIIYNVGIWEARGFEEDYNFELDQSEAVANLINTNVTSPIIYLQQLLPNIKQSSNGKIMLIGSTDGL